MTINAAMPAVPQNMSYSGTAAATDNSTASDFSGALGNMMNAKGTVTAQTAAVSESEMTAVQQEAATGEAVMTAEQTMAMNQLHKELMMKNAGYANSELIAMLLKGADTELTQLMNFDGESPEGIVAQTETVTAIAEGTMTEQLLPEAKTVSEDAESVQTDNVEFIPEMAEETVNATETAEIPVQMADTELSDKADLQTKAAEDTEKITSATMTEEILPADVQTSDHTSTDKTTADITATGEKTAETMATDDAATDAMVQSLTADVNTAEVQTEATGTVRAEDTVKTVTTDAQVNVVSAEDNVKTVTTQTEADTVSTQEQNGTVQQTGDEITFKLTEATAEATTDTVQTAKPTVAKTEDVTVKSDMTEQTPEATEETPDFEVSLARAGRKISEKSEEALQLAKSISGTKSDSDLETEQKVTVKQELTDGGVMRNDVQADNPVRDDVRAERPVRLTVNEAYQIINERASSGGEKQTFTVELTPETLGKITVKMTSENGKLSVEILTETEAAKQLFEARANELANNLRQNDVEIGSYRVETENEQLFNESFDGSSKNPYAEHQQSESPDDEDEFERLISEMMGM